MEIFRILSTAAGLVMLASPAGADSLKAKEILQHISGDWDYVSAPDFEPGGNFCKFDKSRIWMEDQTFHHRSIRSDKPEDYFIVSTGRVVHAETDEIVIMMSLPAGERPANIRIWMRSEDFAVLQVRDSPPNYMKRCPNRELTS